MATTSEKTIGHALGWDEYRYSGYRRFMREDSEADLYVQAVNSYKRGFKIHLYSASPRNFSRDQYQVLIRNQYIPDSTTEDEAIRVAIELAEDKLGLPSLVGEDDGI